jgi:hypothetical protein
MSYSTFHTNDATIQYFLDIPHSHLVSTSEGYHNNLSRLVVSPFFQNSTFSFCNFFLVNKYLYANVDQANAIEMVTLGFAKPL